MATPTTLPSTFVAGNVLTAAQMNNLRGAFRVLQVVQTIKTNTFSTTSTSLVDITGLNVTITPSATSSKVLVIASVTVSQSGNLYLPIKITGGNMATYVGDADGSRTRVSTEIVSPNAAGMNVGIAMYLDSPATTSATTYQVQTLGHAGNTAYINRAHTDTDTSSVYRAASTIIAMEISA